MRDPTINAILSGIMTYDFILFDTAVGWCGVAWGERGIVAVQLPEARAQGTRARLLQRCRHVREATPPPDVARAIDAIVARLRSETEKALKNPSLLEKFAGQGIEPMPMKPAEMDDLVKREAAANLELVKAAGIKQ